MTLREAFLIDSGALYVAGSLVCKRSRKRAGVFPSPEDARKEEDTGMGVDVVGRTTSFLFFCGRK